MKNVATNLSNLKSKVGKLDVDKLVPAPVELSKLIDVVKNGVVKKVVHNAKIKKIEDKITDITNLASNNTLNAKIKEVKKEIPSITNLATTIALTAVENKIPNVSNLVEKTNYNTKVREIENKFTTDPDHDECNTTQEFNKLTLNNFTARRKQANLTSKIDIANFVKKVDLNKNELNELSKKVKGASKRVLTTDLINKFSILNGAKYFSSEIFQNYLILNILVALLGLILRNLMECQKKKLKI